jgi:hypothetical protein
MYMIDIYHTSGISITVGSVVNTPSSKFNGIFYGEIITVTTVKYTIGVGRSRANRKELTLKARSIIVNIIQMGALNKN